MTMLRYDKVLDSVEKKAGYPKEICDAVIKGLSETIVYNTMMGKTVEIPEFGSFKLKFMGARSIPRHYMSGETAMAARHFKLSFSEYKPVKERYLKHFKKQLGLLDEAEAQEKEDSE